MNKSYHKTDSALGHDEVTRRESAAQSQEVLVLAWFKRHPGKEYSPDEVLTWLRAPTLKYRDLRLHISTPITSVRRAITNLEKKGLLRKTNIRRPTPRGATSRTWEWCPPAEPGQGTLF